MPKKLPTKRRASFASSVRKVSAKQRANWARFAKAARSGLWNRSTSGSSATHSSGIPKGRATVAQLRKYRRDAEQDDRLRELEADARIDQFIHRKRRKKRRVNYQRVSQELDAVLHTSPGVF